MNSAVTSPSVLGASHLFLFPSSVNKLSGSHPHSARRLPQLQASSWSTQRAIAQIVLGERTLSGHGCFTGNQQDLPLLTWIHQGLFEITEDVQNAELRAWHLEFLSEVSLVFLAFCSPSCSSQDGEADTSESNLWYTECAVPSLATDMYTFRGLIRFTTLAHSGAV